PLRLALRRDVQEAVAQDRRSLGRAHRRARRDASRDPYAEEPLMRALVTGAAGFIGSNLTMELSRAGDKVVGLDDFSVGHFENLQDFSGDIVAADLADAAQWSGRVGKVDVIFHQAAITDTTVTDQKRMLRVNVEAFRDLLQWAAEKGVKKV